MPIGLVCEVIRVRGMCPTTSSLDHVIHVTNPPREVFKSVTTVQYSAVASERLLLLSILAAIGGSLVPLGFQAGFDELFLQLPFSLLEHLRGQL